MPEELDDLGRAPHHRLELVVRLTKILDPGIESDGLSEATQLGDRQAGISQGQGPQTVNQSLSRIGDITRVSR
jgi:hypothetical protein